MTATGVAIRSFRHSWMASDLAGIVELYNAALNEVYGFFPLTAKRFARRVLRSPHFQPELFLLAFAGKRCVGMLHAAALREPCHETGGTVELIAVHPAFRGNGIGTALLEEGLRRLRTTGMPQCDGGGAFPFSPFYSTLLDGSERSGLALDNAPALALFERQGFQRGRISTVMRATLADRPEPAPPGHALQRVSRKPEGTWLDHVFRGWSLTDSRLVEAGTGTVRTRAIYAPMPDLSAREGQRLYALFGVHTPRAFRGQGWATRHFQALLPHLRRCGADAVELHVYADNAPAVRLYRRAGFAPCTQTVILRRALP